MNNSRAAQKEANLFKDRVTNAVNKALSNMGQGVADAKAMMDKVSKVVMDEIDKELKRNHVDESIQRAHKYGTKELDKMIRDVREGYKRLAEGLSKDLKNFNPDAELNMAVRTNKAEVSAMNALMYAEKEIIKMHKSFTEGHKYLMDGITKEVKGLKEYIGSEKFKAEAMKASIVIGAAASILVGSILLGCAAALAAPAGVLVVALTGVVSLGFAAAIGVLGGSVAGELTAKWHNKIDKKLITEGKAEFPPEMLKDFSTALHSNYQELKDVGTALIASSKKQPQMIV